MPDAVEVGQLHFRRGVRQGNPLIQIQKLPRRTFPIPMLSVNEVIHLSLYDLSIAIDQSNINTLLSSLLSPLSPPSSSSPQPTRLHPTYPTTPTCLVPPLPWAVSSYPPAPSSLPPAATSPTGANPTSSIPAGPLMPNSTTAKPCPLVSSSASSPHIIPGAARLLLSRPRTRCGRRLSWAVCTGLRGSVRFCIRGRWLWIRSLERGFRSFGFLWGGW